MNFWAIEMLSLKIKNTDIFKIENNISELKMLLFEKQEVQKKSESKLKGLKNSEPDETEKCPYFFVNYSPFLMCFIRFLVI